MNKEQMLLDALNRFGNFTSVTQEFSEEQLGVIYELMDMVEQRNKVSGDDMRTEPALPIQNVVGSALKDDERVHYEALQDCCKGILKVVDSGKVPQRGIMGLRLLLPK